MKDHPVRCACAGRRQLLHVVGGVAAGAVLVLAGCGKQGNDAVTVAAVDFGEGTVCSLDGMVLADYAGPKGQIHVAGKAEPVYFCDTVELLADLLQPEQVRKIAAVYVQDMGKADWERPRGHWIDAKTALYVLGSRRHGSMGPTIASFALEADARKFVGEHGGTVLRFAEITPAMVDLGGGAKTDSRM